MFREKKFVIFTRACAVTVALFTAACTRSHERTLRVLTFRDRQSAALRQALPEFEDAFKIKVQFDDIPASTVATKMMTDLAAGGTYDVYAIDEPFIPQFYSALLPVEKWPKTNVNLDLTGFEPKAIEAAKVDGGIVGLPVNGNVYQYIYRKDLFESEAEKIAFQKRFARPLRPAQSMNELLELAQFFHRPPKLYGFAPFTKMSEGTTVELLWLLAGFGYTPGSEIASPTLIDKALSHYGELLKTAPKSARSWHHSERMSAYAKGKVAQMMTWNSFFFDLEDEHKSLVVGRTGYAETPGQQATSVAGSWIAGVSKASPEIGAAAEFIRWWTSREVNERLLSKGLSTARADLLARQDLSTRFPWLTTTHLNFQRAFLRPRHNQYRATSDDLSKAFTRWIAGQATQQQTSETLIIAVGRMNDIALGNSLRKEAH
ncbi:extracellular solute-binding protein [bacterium]|nr:extracellular solute-binding protein [bacterium]